MPAHLHGTRHVFVPEKEKDKDKCMWFLAEVVKYIRFVPEENSELIVRVIDDSGNQSNRTVTARASSALPVRHLDGLRRPPTDLIKLEDSHPPGILFSLSVRYRADQIYTSIGPVLVSFNPFKIIHGLYTLELAEMYKKNKLTLSENPHVFALAADCLRGLEGSVNKSAANQSLIICGESGSGKTEATKQCLFYFASAIAAAPSSSNGKSSSGGGSKRRSLTSDVAALTQSGGIEVKILQASPLLEAWGNAKTLRNNNSSRFGKFIEVYFDKTRKRVIGSSNTTYLLEKSRVVFQDKGERNYHIFYQLLCGEDQALLQELGLTRVAINPVKSAYLGMGQCVSIMDLDDGAEYRHTKEAYAALGFSEQEVRQLTTLLAVVLHLGSVTFLRVDEDDEQRGVKLIEGDRIDLGTKTFSSLDVAINLLGVEGDALRTAFVQKRVKSGGSRRQSFTDKPFKLTEALENKNAFAKELYCRCFDWIVEKINKAVNAASGTDLASRGPGQMVGVLDIFGFEIFEKNSLEQLCINLANEALQDHFNYHIFQAELELYQYERIEVPALAYVSNKDVLDLILSPKNPPGLLALLDDGGKVVGQGDPTQALLNRFNDVYGKHKRFTLKTRFRSFSIQHYAGEVLVSGKLLLHRTRRPCKQASFLLPPAPSPSPSPSPSFSTTRRTSCQRTRTDFPSTLSRC